MATSEVRRHDLYNRLDELLGTEEADTLMAYLPTDESTSLATKDDIRRLEDRIQGLEDHMQRLEDQIRAVNQRLDKFFLTQSAGLIAIVGTLVAAVLL